MAMSIPPDQIEIFREKCVDLSQAKNKDFVLVTGKLITANVNLLPTDCFPEQNVTKKI